MHRPRDELAPPLLSPLAHRVGHLDVRLDTPYMAKLHDIWRSCTTDLGEVWCRTDYSEWYYPFSKFTPLTYAVIAVWGMVPPLAILAWGGVVYWALTGFSH
jgi:hypothetical protein